MEPELETEVGARHVPKKISCSHMHQEIVTIIIWFPTQQMKARFSGGKSRSFSQIMQLLYQRSCCPGTPRANLWRDTANTEQTGSPGFSARSAGLEKHFRNGREGRKHKTSIWKRGDPELILQAPPELQLLRGLAWSSQGTTGVASQQALTVPGCSVQRRAGGHQ